MALQIKVDGTRVKIKGEKPNGALSYEQIRAAVGGGYIQWVSCDAEVTGGYDHYYCDEEGKLKNFPPNPEATKLSTYTAEDDVLVGDILFCTSAKSENDEVESY